MLSGGHSYKLWWTFSTLLGIFSVFLLDIMFDVLGENIGYGVQNVGHVGMSDDFSYSLIRGITYRISLDSQLLAPSIDMK